MRGLGTRIDCSRIGIRGLRFRFFGVYLARSGPPSQRQIQTAPESELVLSPYRSRPSRGPHRAGGLRQKQAPARPTAPEAPPQRWRAREKTVHAPMRDQKKSQFLDDIFCTVKPFLDGILDSTRESQSTHPHTTAQRPNQFSDENCCPMRIVAPRKHSRVVIICMFCETH